MWNLSFDLRKWVDTLCGRYEFTAEQSAEIQHIVQEVQARCGAGQWKPGEIYPTNKAPVLRIESGNVRPDLLVWGFPVKGKPIINARAETAAEKPLFHSCIQQRRCIIPSTEFYEWNAQKQKFLLRLPDQKELYMAGIYQERNGQEYYCIITTAANQSMQEIHQRMPLVLTAEQQDAWLLDAGEAVKILRVVVPPALEKTAVGALIDLW